MTATFTIRRSEERGHADHGWLKAKHSFSFADYHDSRFMGFRSLRVINQDVIAALGGFPLHPHRNMEIFSYILEGEIEHEDSMGNHRVLQPGEVQLMSAGSGVQHAERNPSDSENLHLLQIWIEPSLQNLTPSYTEWKPVDKSQRGKVLVISPDGRELSAKIHQDVFVYRLLLDQGEQLSHTIAAGRAVWIQLISGSLNIEGETLSAGDAFSSETLSSLDLDAIEAVEALLFDLQ